MVYNIEVINRVGYAERLELWVGIWEALLASGEQFHF
jgi:hypothetical protein